MIAIDCETTGLSSFHGCKYFFVSTCNEDGEQLWFEWDVDPFTREPQIPREDVDEIRVNLGTLMTDEVLGHNIKFDAHMFNAVGIGDWPWERTHDTIIAAHLLDSGQPKDLTSLVLTYLNEDIKPEEDALEVAVKKARSSVQQARLKVKRNKTGSSLFGDAPVNPMAAWRIADEDDPALPNSKEEWRSDYWMPRAVAKHLKYPADHPWWTVLSDYANHDTAVLPTLWKLMRSLLEDRGLWPLYIQKRDNLRVLFDMERRGTTVHRSALVPVREEYEQDIEECKAFCNGIAESRNYELVLPKSGNNKSLSEFLFGVMDLPVIKTTPSGAPSFDKGVIEEYKKMLQGDQLRFVQRLSDARKRQKSCEFFDAYEAFGIPSQGDILILHPSVNPVATATTRVSMSNPNLQQVSHQESECEECGAEGCEKCKGTGEDLHNARQVFGPGPGREWWTMDAKNIELKIPVFESKEPSLMELFNRPNDPPFYGSQHMLNMSIVHEDVWQKELKAVGIKNVGPHCKKKYASREYLWAKCGGLAMQYQCGEETADRAFHKRGGYRKLKEHFTKLDRLNAKYVAMAERLGYVETLPDSSLSMTRGYPLQCSRSSWGRILPTVPLNYHVQGSAGWWMVMATNRCGAQLREWNRGGFDGYICLTVHDELVFDFPKKAHPIKNPKASNLGRARILQKLMQRGGDDIGIPISVSCEYHEHSWAAGIAV